MQKSGHISERFHMSDVCEELKSKKNGRCSHLDTPSIMSRSASEVIDLIVHGSPHGIQFVSTHLFPRADRDRAGQSAATLLAACCNFFQ